MLVYMCPNCGWLYLPKDYCEENPEWKGNPSGYLETPPHGNKTDKVCQGVGKLPMNSKDKR